MAFKKVEVYNAVVIEVKGKLEGGPEAAEFHEMIDSAIESGKKHVIIDMQNVKFVNSTGLGILVRGYTTLKNAGGDMKLAAISDKVQGVLSITKLSTVFTYYESVEEAANSF